MFLPKHDNDLLLCKNILQRSCTSCGKETKRNYKSPSKANKSNLPYPSYSLCLTLFQLLLVFSGAINAFKILLPPSG